MRLFKSMTRLTVLRNIAKHFNEKGAIPREHDNTGKNPANSKIMMKFIIPPPNLQTQKRTFTSVTLYHVKNLNFVL